MGWIFRKFWPVILIIIGYFVLKHFFKAKVSEVENKVKEKIANVVGPVIEPSKQNISETGKATAGAKGGGSVAGMV